MHEYSSRHSHRYRSDHPAARTNQTLRLLIAALLFGASSLWSLEALADTSAGTEIRNTAVGAFEDPEDLGNVLEVTSNEVVLVLAEVAGITAVSGPNAVIEAPATVADAGPSQADDGINPEDVVYFTFTLANVGNDPTQFFIPGAPSSISGGTLSDEIQIVAYDPDGTGTSVKDLTTSRITVPASGATTGALLNGVVDDNGSIQVNGSLTLRVPVKIEAGLVDGDLVTVVMGDTPVPPNDSNQNQPYSAGGRDIYTEDNPDATPAEAAGEPINGDPITHRQEAAASQSVPVGLPTGGIAGRVWKDDDGDGIRSGSETGMDGIAVEVFDLDGVSQGSIATSGGGFYEFFNLPIGDYVVGFSPPDTSSVTLLDQGGDDTVDSDVKIVVNQTDPVSVVNKTVTDNVDLGLVSDSDRDSITDPVEGTGDLDGDGTPNFLDFDPTGYFYDEANGEIIPGGLVTISGDGAEQLTIKHDGSNGYYQWLGEVPGVYTQTIILPPGYEFSDVCLLRETTEVFDPTGGPAPTIIGAFQEGTTGFLQNTTCARSYLTFDLEPGDPIVINNNIPLKRIATDGDYGDAPDAGIGTGPEDYQTIAIDNGPIHSVVAGIQLGSTVTADADGAGFSGSGSSGDATDDTGDDGVRIGGTLLQDAVLTVEESATLEIATQGNGVLSAWVDWNANGTFEPGEQIAENISPVDDAISISVAIPGDAAVGNTYARFRFSSESDLAPTGMASDGEVEDYRVAIASTKGTASGIVWEDANFNGIQDPDEPGLNDITLSLVDAADTVQETTITADGGLYTFSEIEPEDYTIRVETPANYVLSPQTQGGDSAADSDVNRVTGETDLITVGESALIDDISAGLAPDADGDTIPDVIDGTGDRDGDGTPNFLDVDPAGYFYDEVTGQVIPGGSITVSGPGAINIADNGNATGYYQWFIDGTAGTYTMTINPPPGYEQSTTCLVSTSPPSPFDPTGLTPDPYELGSVRNDTTNALDSANCGDNPFYLEFDLVTGDPFIINNNIPLKVTASPAPGVCPSSQQGGLASTSITPYISSEVGPDGVANRDSAIGLDDSWRTAAQADGLNTFQTWIESGPDTTIASPYQLLDTANGASVDVFVSSLDMTNIDDCTGTVSSAAIQILDNATLQDNAPRPNATATDPAPDLYDTAAQPYYWNQSGGSTTSRNGVLFEFSSPVSAFGAWFGDLETRADGGTPAILRLLDVNDVQIGQDQIIEPDPSFFASEADCGGSNSTDITGCGNSTTRWIGFVDPLARVSKMVVIVGDDDLGEDGNTERLSFIGATVASATNAADLILVKRITALNTTAVTGFVDGPGGEDNNALWPTDYLQGAIGISDAQPGDEIEYTIYFLSSGSLDLTEVNICDAIPADTTYVAGSGELALGTNASTAWDDTRNGDVGEYIAAGTAVTATDMPGIGLCRGDRDTTQNLTAAENPNGVVWAQIDNALTPIPSGQTGYIRFRVRIDSPLTPD